MWLTVGNIGAIELTFRHTHDGVSHVHPMEIAFSIEAHRICHRIGGRELARSTLQQ